LASTIFPQACSSRNSHLSQYQTSPANLSQNANHGTKGKTILTLPNKTKHNISFNETIFLKYQT
jgi:hypothetical protein